jgi:zinc transport system substrate-binding protein
MRLSLAAMLTAAALAAGCVSSPGQPTGRLAVVASVFPLYDMAKAVGGEKAQVELLIAPGSEVHGFEPTPRKVVDLASADMLLVNGLGLEPWSGRLSSASGNARLTLVDASAGIEPMMLGGAADPHVFEDPLLAQTQLSNVLAAYEAADPGNAAYYRANAERYRSSLASLDGRFRAGLMNCTCRTVIVDHAFLGYTARRYGFTQIPLSGLNPDSEPAPQDLRSAAQAARDGGARAILYEAAMPQAVARTVAREAGLEAAPIASVHEVTLADYDAGKTYPDLLGEQLATLRSAMGCA